MKTFEPFTFDYSLSVKELNEFQEFLKSKNELSEKDEILPFFRKRKQLTALMGTLNPNIARFDRVAFELSLMGTFACDVAIGDSISKSYCLIEFEDAKKDSMFKKNGKKDKLEWSPRFEHGFSQIVDWLWLLDDFKSTKALSTLFGNGDISFTAFLIVGRSKHVTEEGEQRLRWRQNKTWVNSHQVFCFTFDELLKTLELKTSVFESIAQQKAG